MRSKLFNSETNTCLSLNFPEKTWIKKAIKDFSELEKAFISILDYSFSSPSN